MLRIAFKATGTLFCVATLFASACITATGDDADENRNEYLDGWGDSSNPSGGDDETSSGATNPSGGNESSGSGTPMNPPDTQQPGDLCDCDSECVAMEGHEGICVLGVCMTKPTADCASAGSTTECNSGSRCWSLENSGSVCFPDCSTFECGGQCDGDDSCMPTDTTSCDYGCGTVCPCNPGDCAQGEQCIGGACVPEAMTGNGPGPGPGPTCNNLPERDCTGSASYCGELITMDPRTTAHYDDYPLNGETSSNQYRSFLRRDLSMLLDYATAKVLCKAANWDPTFGNGGPLGFGDMSEANGEIPGTSINSPGHPAGTHVNGFDIDLGYYQVNTADNKLRPVCQHQDYHCIAPPHLLDTWRNALFLGALLESNRVRVIGMDGQVGPLMEAAINQLCIDGWVDTYACNHLLMAYETTNMNYGWYYFHHHHQHVSMCPGNSPCNTATSAVGTMPSIGEGWLGTKFKPHPYKFGVPTL